MLRKWEAAECNGELPSSFAPPVVVLGFPNSGSRLIANVLRSGGVDMGSRTNAMEDAMCFAPLFERYLHDDIPYHRILLQQSDAGIDEEAFARELGTAMCMHFNGKATAHPNYHPPRCLAGGGAPEAAVWGWKESRWMWLMPLLHRLMPSCTFVHAVRNGLERKASKESPDSLHGQADALQEKVLNEHAHKSAQGQVEAAGAVISALQVDEREARINAKAHGSVDPDRQILGNAEVPEGMEGVLLWDKINTLVADYGEKREGEERGESAREGEEEGESVREREEYGSASEIP